MHRIQLPTNVLIATTDTIPGFRVVRILSVSNTVGITPLTERVIDNAVLSDAILETARGTIRDLMLRAGQDDANAILGLQHSHTVDLTRHIVTVLTMGTFAIVELLPPGP